MVVGRPSAPWTIGLNSSRGASADRRAVLDGAREAVRRLNSAPSGRGCARRVGTVLRSGPSVRELNRPSPSFIDFDQGNWRMNEKLAGTAPAR